MRTLILSLIIIFFAGIMSFAQEDEIEADVYETNRTNRPDSTGFGGSAFIGGVTIDGKNYQQFGLRADIPIGKLGLGVDLHLLLDEKGHIRKEDWDEWHDYLDKLYYIRWGHKGDPVYIRFGGLDYTYLGYQNVVNGYTNMIEYPTVKRYGLDMDIEVGKFRSELFINDFKEMFEDQASMVFATRLSYKVLGKLTVGGTFAADFNEYNALKDRDDDGFPDEVDKYPENSKWVTEYDKFLRESDFDMDFVDKAVEYGLCNDTITRDQVFDKNRNRSKTTIWSVDLGYPLLDGEKLKLDVYTQFTQITNYGWGITAPGIMLRLGNFITFNAEYRTQSKEFLFGYFNNTYEIERASFVSDVEGNKHIVTKRQSLENIKNSMNGYFAGLNLNLINILGVGIYYQDLRNTDMIRRSIRGEVGLKNKLIPNLVQAKAYYIQNNVQDFREWKTPSTVMGYLIAYELKGTTLGFDYRFTFQDRNGDGKIRGSEETIRTFGFKTSIRF